MVKRIKNLKEDGLGITLPPKREFVRIYFMQKGLSQKQADFFYDHFDECLWKDSIGSPLKNWKTLACDWIWELLHQ
jgi:hypothetical protein